MVLDELVEESQVELELDVPVEEFELSLELDWFLDLFLDIKHPILAPHKLYFFETESITMGWSSIPSNSKTEMCVFPS